MQCPETRPKKMKKSQSNVIPELGDVLAPLNVGRQILCGKGAPKNVQMLAVSFHTKQQRGGCPKQIFDFV
jgi:hypothetical protein